MPGRALSECQKKQKACEIIKGRTAKAVIAYLAEQQKEPSLHRGLCVIAELLKIDHNKLAHAVKGGRSIDEANSAKQKLTPAE